MNDRAVSLLENYDITVSRTYKGRGCILCETNQGLKIFKEFRAPLHKLALMDHLLKNVADMNLVAVDTLVKTREGEYLVKDRDSVTYVLKDYYDAEECCVKREEELKDCMRTMALLHTGLYCPREAMPDRIERFDLQSEVTRHNMLLRKIRKYVREKGTKTAFERYLLTEYDSYLAQADCVMERLLKEDFQSFYEKVERERSFIHGDFQYHNVLFGASRRAVVNFERCRYDNRVGDISLFLRKIMEKFDWDPALGMRLLAEYEKISPLDEKEKRQLFYRMSYPEKFRKVVSAYYNSNKAFQSQVFGEKLQAICNQEARKRNFMSKVFDDVIE